MNPAPGHLEAKLRFGWDFTVGQIAAMIAGILIGFAWANWISPIRGIGAAVTGVYVGGLPVAAGFIASQTEFDLWAALSSAVRWRRVGGRFVPGAGEEPSFGAAPAHGGGDHSAEVELGLRGDEPRGDRQPADVHAGHGRADAVDRAQPVRPREPDQDPADHRRDLPDREVPPEPELRLQMRRSGIHDPPRSSGRGWSCG